MDELIKEKDREIEELKAKVDKVKRTEEKLDKVERMAQKSLDREENKERTFMLITIALLISWINIVGPIFYQLKDIALVAQAKTERDGLFNFNVDLPPFTGPKMVPVSKGHLKALIGRHFLDESPPGTYDFTLQEPGKKGKEQFEVLIPSPCDGKIRRTWFQGRNGNLKTGKGAGQVVEIDCEGTNYYWLMGHLIEGSPPKAGTIIKKGQSIGRQGITGRTSGYHVHAQIHLQEGGKRITNRRVTRPIVMRYIDWINGKI